MEGFNQMQQMMQQQLMQQMQGGGAGGGGGGGGNERSYEQQQMMQQQMQQQQYGGNEAQQQGQQQGQQQQGMMQGGGDAGISPDLLAALAKAAGAQTGPTGGMPGQGGGGNMQQGGGNMQQGGMGGGMAGGGMGGGMGGMGMMMAEPEVARMESHPLTGEGAFFDGSFYLGFWKEPVFRNELDMNPLGVTAPPSLTQNPAGKGVNAAALARFKAPEQCRYGDRCRHKLSCSRFHGNNPQTHGVNCSCEDDRCPLGHPLRAGRDRTGGKDGGKPGPLGVGGPPAGRRPPPGYVCAKCKAPNDHYLNECPENVCYKCGEKGHIATTCTNERRPRAGDRDRGRDGGRRDGRDGGGRDGGGRDGGGYDEGRLCPPVPPGHGGPGMGGTGAGGPGHGGPGVMDGGPGGVKRQHPGDDGPGRWGYSGGPPPPPSGGPGGGPGGPPPPPSGGPGGYSGPPPPPPPPQ